ncbi:MAG: Crp/Fnr family transcriptional regulator, partial [Aquisalinus sp.]|nr:Crp/Fnr family transcriptional regulator [Aquisalinus sp.]
MVSTATSCDDNLETEQQVQHLLSSFQPFDSLPEDALTLIAQSTYYREFSAGETVFTMSQYDGDDIFCIISGNASLTTMLPSTGALSVEELSGGQIFGLEYILGDFGQHDLQAGMAAVTDFIVLQIEGDKLLDLVKRKPLVARAFLSSFAKRLLESQHTSSVHADLPGKRILRALFDLLEQDHQHFPSLWRITSMPKHRELAEVSGSSEVEVAEVIARL